MRLYLSSAVAGFVCLTIVACQTGGLSEQDQAAIRKLDDYYVKNATAEKPDWNAAVDLCYAEDAKVLPPNMPPLEGRQAIKAMYAQLQPSFKEFRFDILSLEGRGDLAVEYGAYTAAAAPSGPSAPFTDRGKYVAVWKKQDDGTWKMIRDIYNSGLPVPGLVVPAGAAKSDAGPELKQLEYFVGRWKVEGDAKASPFGPAGKFDAAMNCQWFPGGGQVVCSSTGTAPTGPFQELTTYSYDADAKAYIGFDVDNTGFSAAAKGSFQGGNWIFLFDTRAGAKPIKVRLTLSASSAAGGEYKQEFSIAGGPWTLFAEGKATKAN
jgi:ketosteroid isomerase-like protein